MKAHLTETLCVKITPELKEKIDRKLPNPSEWVRDALQRRIKDENKVK